MSAELLRQAAALMRERAEAVDLAPTVFGDDVAYTWAEQIGYIVTEPDATHLTTFGHPAVALAVADWLEAEADRLDDDVATYRPAVARYDSETAWIERNHRAPLTVARAYLGESADD